MGHGGDGEGEGEGRGERREERKKERIEGRGRKLGGVEDLRGK